MQALEIYKKLPKTHCGDCGESACMAFALKVQTGQRNLSDCPHVEGGVGGRAPDKAVTVEDSYEQASNLLEVQLRDADFKDAAAAIGAEYDPARDVINLTMLNRPVEVRREGLFEHGAHCRDSWSKLIAYDYVLRKGSAPLAGQWVPFEHFPRTPSHVKAFQQRAEAQLALAFEKNPASLREQISKLGGVESAGEAKADLASRLQLLPRLSLYLQFWAADDDFPAGSQILA